MTDDFLKVPDEAGMRRADRRITQAGVTALVVFGLVGVAAWHLLPQLFEIPAETADQLAFALKAALVPLICLAVAILMVSNGRRYSPEDIGGSAAGPPSPRVAVQAAFLQNTLEQAALATGSYLIFAVALSGPWLTLIPISAGMFMTGRALFFLGYRRGVEGRAYGMTLTMMPSLLLLVFALAAILLGWL